MTPSTHVLTLDAILARNLAGFTRRALPTDGRKAAAVAIAVHERPDGPALWITRRTSQLRNHSGQFALPGGRLDPGETPELAALRELDEELGVPATSCRVLGLLDDYATRSGYLMTPVVVWAGFSPAVRPNPDEVAELHHVPLSDVDVAPRHVSIPESDRPVIQLPLLGTLIHAPTAAVLHQFAEVALHGRSTRVAHLEQPVFAWQ
jgi:8-oxo-dGTP pyrophosphatase MutT (NUDIX family)